MVVLRREILKTEGQNCLQCLGLWKATELGASVHFIDL